MSQGLALTAELRAWFVFGMYSSLVRQSLSGTLAQSIIERTKRDL